MDHTGNVFEHPCTAVFSGPTGSGKTQLVKNIILSIILLMVPAPLKIIWYYSEYQAQLVAEIGHLVEFREGLPDLDEFTGEVPTLIIVDDLMAEANSEITKLFTKGSHHRNLSIFFLMQNFFHQGKEIRTITLNAQYIVLFKNPRDTQQVRVLARQMYGKNSGFMEEAYIAATEEPHGYLLIDLKQTTPTHLRLQSKILPGEQHEIYVCKKLYKEPKLTVFHQYDG